MTAPPKELGLDPFYTKYVSAHGLPIVGSAKVSDFALREAAYLVDQMLSHRPEIRDAMIEEQDPGRGDGLFRADDRYSRASRHEAQGLLGHARRGLGASRRDSGGQLRRREPAQLSRRSVFHREHPDPRVRPRNCTEWACAAVDPTFGTRLRKAYNDAKDKGLWKGTYAGSNPGEYWAEGVQSWFDTNRQNDSQHNHVDTRDELKAYDPELAKLCNEVFGDGPWRYVRPDHRKEKAHLAGFDLSHAPAFQWEPELLEARRKHYEEVERKSKKDRAGASSKTED